MQFFRVFSILTAFVFCFVAASPVSESQRGVAKRQEDQILAIIAALHPQAVEYATEIKTLADGGNATEEDVTAAFGKLTGVIDSATAQLAAIDAPVLSKRQDTPDPTAVAVANLITELAHILDGVLEGLAGVGTIGVLFGGLDIALNQLLKGLEGLLAGVLNLVAKLLVNVAQLLRNLALGLTLGSLGL